MALVNLEDKAKVNVVTGKPQTTVYQPISQTVKKVDVVDNTNKNVNQITPVTTTTYTDNSAELARLKQVYDQQNSAYDTRLRQLQDAYSLSQKQLADQQAEQEASSTRLAQQAYVTKKQAERVSPNVLASQGLAQTGYENIAKQKIAQTYEGSYGNIMADYQSALNQLKRSQESAQLSYQQDTENVGLDKASAYQDYLYNVAKSNASAVSTTTEKKATTTQNNNATDAYTALTNALSGQTRTNTQADATNFINSKLTNKEITQTQADQLKAYAKALVAKGR